MRPNKLVGVLLVLVCVTVIAGCGSYYGAHTNGLRPSTSYNVMGHAVRHYATNKRGLSPRQRNAGLGLAGMLLDLSRMTHEREISR